MVLKIYTSVCGILIYYFLAVINGYNTGRHAFNHKCGFWKYPIRQSWPRAVIFKRLRNLFFFPTQCQNNNRDWKAMSLGSWYYSRYPPIRRIICSQRKVKTNASITSNKEKRNCFNTRETTHIFGWFNEELFLFSLSVLRNLVTLMTSLVFKATFTRHFELKMSCHILFCNTLLKICKSKLWARNLFDSSKLSIE